jgi:ribosomal protein L7Ae-like RNA K-turn-binding protein
VGLWIEAGLADDGSGGGGSGGNDFAGVKTVAWGGVKRKDCLVVADMLDASGAVLAAAKLQGLVLQGRALEVFACSADGSALADVKTLQFAGERGAVGGRRARLAIAGYLDSDELQEIQESGDRTGIVSDELVAVRHDLLSLIALSAAEEEKEGGGAVSYANKERIGVCRSLRFYAGTAAMAAAHKTTHDAGGGHGEVLYVAFSKLVDAQRAMVWIDGSTIGGASVSCVLSELAPSTWTDPTAVARRRHVMESRAAREESERMLQVSLSTLAPSASRPPRRSSVPSGPARLPKANASPPLVDTDTDAVTGIKSARAGVTDKVCHSNEELDVLTKALLTALARFQSNALEKDAVKAKGDPRFVMGLKQCTNGVKSGRARLVLLACDPEASEALDAKIGTLLLQAANKLDKDDEPVPVLVSLSRRQLGKAVHSNMRQAAVAIYKPDGAYAEFKKLVAYIRAHDERVASGIKL